MAEQSGSVDRSTNVISAAEREPTFVEECLAGEASPDDIDEWVDFWQDVHGEGSLADFLGFTREEYVAWAKNHREAAVIIEARRKAQLEAKS